MTERRPGGVRRALRRRYGPRTGAGGGARGSGETHAGEEGVRADPDGRWLAAVVHTAFFLLWATSVVRFLTRYEPEVRTAWLPALFLLFGALYPAGLRWAPAPAPGPGPGRRPTARHLVWLGALLATWTVLLVVAPSATWCVLPLLFTGVHHLPERLAVPLAAALTALVVGTELRVNTGGFNPNIVVAPVCLAAVATAVLVHSRRQTARQTRLVEDLLRTREELAAAERRAGILAERQRLSAEIHDTLAQNLSSQQMLLQAADRLWDDAPERARGHVRDAAGTATRGLAEARRFVRDLAPLDLADSTLAPALHALAERESRPGDPPVTFRLDGTPGPLPERVEAAVLRVVQGALANVREHAGATRAVLTLTCVDDDRIVVDIADDGRGFDAARHTARTRTRTGRSRGHGLDTMRHRTHHAGGTFTVESAPGEGCVVTVSVPVRPCPDGHVGNADAGEDEGEAEYAADDAAHALAAADAGYARTTGALATPGTSGTPGTLSSWGAPATFRTLDKDAP